MYFPLKKIVVEFSLSLLLSGVSAQQKTSVPKSYIAYKISENITIDGKGEEASWKNAKWTSDFIDIEGVKEPRYQTRVKMLWDKKYLYFYAELEEPHVWGTLKQRDTIIFYNNDFEIFIDPDGDTYNYIEFEMNALNTIWDLYLTKPYREGGKVIDNWDIKGVKTAVHINGIINNTSDIDQGWSVEIAMPWASLTEAGDDKIPVDDYWRINFSRVNWDYELDGNSYRRRKDTNGKFLPEYNWVWSPQWVVNMHEPEQWGYVYFSSDEKENSKNEFIVPPDEKIKLELYSLYRKQKAHQRKSEIWIESYQELINSPIFVEGKEIEVTFDSHSEGWDLIAYSPFTGRQLILSEDGEFKVRTNN